MTAPLIRMGLLGLLVGCTSTAAPVPGAPAAPTPPAPPLAGTVTGTAADASRAIPPSRDDGRLPSDVRPLHYALDLKVDPSTPAFSGRAWIGVVIDRPTRAIVLHGRGLTVREAAIVRGGRRLPVQVSARPSASSGQDAEELVLLAGTPVPAGEAELDISYEGAFAAGLKGLYRVEQPGAAYAYTQFEPNDARRAFPCFDEPGYKTPFDVAITVPAGSLAVANMPESTRRNTDDGKGVRFEFQRSPPLPTYLVALAVGPFDILEGATGPVPLRLVATKGQAHLGATALTVAAAHLALLGTYFDRPYPYAKMDIVAVPNFGSGAMENAGLMTFREELVLLDPARASTAARRASASVIAHELAHQWFGDLVTMKWWDDLWLNEAFASWMSDKIVDAWRPETRARLNNLTGKWQVMAEDALSTARKIRNPVRNTSQAREAFDAITYGKGRSVLAMAEAWLGEDVFRDGLRRYIKKHEWGNATAADLYAALAEASGGRPVAAVMDSFTDQTGVPQVTVTTSCPSGTLSIEQRDYHTINLGEWGKSGFGAWFPTWRVPVCVSGAGPSTAPRCTLLESVRQELPAPTGPEGKSCSAFVYGNANENGYFRVRLTAEDLGRLGPATLGALPESERAGVVNNAWASVWSGNLHAAELLAFLRGFRAERSRLVWVQIVDALNGIDRGLVSESARPALSRLSRDLLTPAVRRLGWSSPPERAAQTAESDEDKLLRELLLTTLGRLGDDRGVLAEARRRATLWLDRADALPADLARVALPLAARKGDSRLFERLLAALKNAPTPEVRLLALAGLCGFDDPALVRRALDLTLDGTIRAQDLRYVFPPLVQRRATRDTTFAWIESHFDQLAPKMPSSQISRFIRLGGALCDAERVRALQTFLQPRVERIEGAAKDMRQAVEEGFRCATLADTEREPTSNWLAPQRPDRVRSVPLERPPY